MVRSNRGRDAGRDTRRAVGSWSHQLHSHRGFSRTAVLRGAYREVVIEKDVALSGRYR